MATTKFPQITFLIFSAIITILFCIAIGSNISPFFRGPAPYPPEWQWAYQFTNTLVRLWAPAVVGLFGVFGFLYFDNDKTQTKRFFTLQFLAFNVIFLLLLEIAMLYFSRAGIGVLVERIINHGITGYFTTALSVQNIGNFLGNYQQQVSHFPMRAADHPPFAVLFFSLILFLSQQLQFLFPVVEKITIHHADIAKIWNILVPYQKLAALLSAIVIPILSAFVVVPLYYFTKLYYNEKTAIRASMLYSVFPAISLFLPLNDVFLGLFGVLGFLGILLGQKQKRVLYYVFVGISFAVGAFFSASLLVVGVMGIFFLLLSSYQRKEKLIGILGLLGGLGILPVVLFVFFKFNTIAVFIEITKLQAKRSYVPWVFYDLYDFFVFAGIPILISSAILIKDLFTKKLHDNLPILFFGILFFLDIAGFSRAETGRIWMPYMPLLAVISANFLTKKGLTSNMFGILLLLQLVQLLVMQEFWVTLW